MKGKLATICLSLAIAAKAQTNEMDSLQHILPAITNDTLKLRTLKRLVDIGLDAQPELAEKYRKQGAALAAAMPWPRGIAVFHGLAASMHSNAGRYAEAIRENEAAMSIYLATKDSFNIASTYNNMGTVYLRQSDYAAAVQQYEKARQMAEAMGNRALLANVFTNLADLYANQENNEQAIAYTRLAMASYGADGNIDGQAAGYQSLGNAYYRKRDTLTALTHYRQSLVLFEQTGNDLQRASVYSNMALSFPNDPQQRLDYQLKAEALWDSTHPAHAISLTNLGNMFYTYRELAALASIQQPAQRTILLNKAEQQLQKAMALRSMSNDVGSYAFLLGAQSELEKERGNYKEAYTLLRKHYELNDSIYSQETKNKIAALEGRREVALRDEQLQKNAVLMAAGRQQRWFYIGGIAFLSVIGALLFWQNRQRRNNNRKLQQLNNALAEANQQKAKFFAILSHDLRSPVAGLVNFLHLQQSAGLLSPEAAALHRDRIGKAAEELLENMEALLLWAKGQMDAFGLQLQPVTPESLFARLKMAGGEAVHCTDEQAGTVLTDPDYLFTILSNLQANALRAIPEQNGRVNWRCFSDSRQWHMEISDNGDGLSDQASRALFADEPLAGGRNGFGFYLVRDLSKRLGSTITIIPQPAGTCIRVSLPLPNTG